MKELTAILASEYDVSIGSAPTCAILWAAEKCQDPRKALSAANRKRVQMGKPLAHAQYGSTAF